MAGFNIGGLLGGLTDGLKKGIQLDTEFLKSFIWASKAGNVAALNDLITIAEQNVKELVDATGNVLPNLIGELISGSDPTSGSRHAFQAWQTKYGVH